MTERACLKEEGREIKEDLEHYMHAVDKCMLTPYPMYVPTHIKNTHTYTLNIDVKLEKKMKINSIQNYGDNGPWEAVVRGGWILVNAVR